MVNAFGEIMSVSIKMMRLLDLQQNPQLILLAQLNLRRNPRLVLLTLSAVVAILRQLVQNVLREMAPHGVMVNAFGEIMSVSIKMMRLLDLQQNPQLILLLNLQRNLRLVLLPSVVVAILRQLVQIVLREMVRLGVMANVCGETINVSTKMMNNAKIAKTGDLSIREV